LEEAMKALVAATLVLGLCLGGGPNAFAEYREGPLLTPSEGRAYRACLFEAWIEDYCHGNSLRPTSTAERVYAACVVANGGFPLEGRTWGNTDDYCWSAARHFR
jgi:hypothetical protein